MAEANESSGGGDVGDDTGRGGVAFTKAGDSVSLQVQLMVASSGRLITGEKDVVVRLVSPVSTGQTVYWEKTHESVSINEVY